MLRFVKIAWIAAMMGIISLAPAGWLYAEGNNLLQNPGFEQVSGNSPDQWSRDVWVQTEGASDLEAASDQAHSGSSSAVVENLQPDHAKWVQRISVRPDTDYSVSGWIRVEEMGSGEVGATIFPLGVGGPFPHLTESDGQWKQVQFYGRTGPEQQELTIAAGIGGYGHLNTGKAYFDDLQVEEAGSLPEGVVPLSLEPPAPSAGGGGESQDGTAQTAAHVSVLPILLFSTLFGLLFVLLYQRMLRRKTVRLGEPEGREHLWFAAILVVSLLLRIGIALTARGFETDMNTFMAWAQHAVDRGIGGFYVEGMFADYPPGYIYVLYVLGSICNVFALGFDAAGTQLLFKFPSIVTDLIAGYLIYQTADKKLGGKTALALSVLYLLNPAVLINSSAWGQVDSFYVLFLLVSIMALIERRFERSAVWLAVAALIKPQTLIFAPVWLIACLYYRDGRRIGRSVLYGIGAFGLLALPFFWGNGGLSGLIDLYRSTLSSYPFASVNAFNIYALFGHNWSPLDNRWLLLSFRAWGMLAIVAAVAYAGYISFRKKWRGRDLTSSYFIALALIAIMFVLGTKMHERYMFPALILSLFSYMEVKDSRLLGLFMGFSLTQYVNTAYVLGFLNGGSSPGEDGIVYLCSIANIGLLAYMLYLGLDIYVKKRILPLEPLTRAGLQERDCTLLADLTSASVTPHSVGARSVLRRVKGWIWIILITLVYLAVALYQLGSFRAPQTVWTPSSGGDGFYIDFGDVKQLEKVNIFGGTGHGKFKLEFGADDSAWGDSLEVVEDHGSVFTWKSQPLQMEARYAKLTVEEPGFSLHEMAFYEQGGTGPLPVLGIHGDDGLNAKEEQPGLLFDEPSDAVSKPDFYNGTYFDEIYHARTAYEYLHGLPAYETTHPPLGKLLIAVGIKAFGLSPFGWRIIGTLFGAAMLPLIYAFALRLFGQRKYAIMSAVLFAAEFMHFTQTRIATIDVYGVFFILLMFYFMSRYFNLNFHRDGLGKTLVPLFWAGLFFGIGVASKWIVVYGGAGLAVMLGISLYFRYREYAAARSALVAEDLEHPEPEERISLYRRTVAAFPKNMLLTLGACVIFFVLIPGAVYALSFIPQLAASPGGFTWQALIQAQKDMFDYHSRLVSDHPFASSWWEWPFMKRPVWYYGGEWEPTGIVSTIVTMGNPLIWWTGVFMLVLTIWLSLKRKDRFAYVIWIAYLAQYIPWMLVSRETFLYHYFAMVPFMVLAIVYTAKVIEERVPRLGWIRKWYMALAVLLFIAFYPALSGMPVSSFYVEHILRWFLSWVF
ncbi:glycosyltransferase family 39 protein [Paenibacillus sp. M1]|uniref:Polyprenol-phosphate-mannose--protein mannosyltransferase n=1 Tax=Paenibacillus haidiansis TaxID=1574488 RepID=A0ABU7VQP2_9BACL